MTAFMDLSGQVYGRLTVLRRHDQSRPVRWDCRCSCGNEHVCIAVDLRSGKTRSCGCLRKDAIRGISKKHGMFESTEYKIWASMHRRCKDHRNYSARGISVCERWIKFENFLADMGGRPSSEYSLDRINNDGNYEPGNCRWATARQQANNTRRTRIVEYHGETLTLAEAISRSGSTLKYRTILSRVCSGWDVERALTEKCRQGVVSCVSTETSTSRYSSPSSDRF